MPRVRRPAPISRSSGSRFIEQVSRDHHNWYKRPVDQSRSVASEFPGSKISLAPNRQFIAMRKGGKFWRIRSVGETCEVWFGDDGTKGTFRVTYREGPASRNPGAASHRQERRERERALPCLDLLILLGEAHLRLTVREYVAHHNRERPHQVLGGALVVPPANENTSGPSACTERRGGLLRFYRRHAASLRRSQTRTRWGNGGFDVHIDASAEVVSSGVTTGVLQELLSRARLSSASASSQYLSSPWSDGSGGYPSLSRSRPASAASIPSSAPSSSSRYTSLLQSFQTGSSSWHTGLSSMPNAHL